MMGPFTNADKGAQLHSLFKCGRMSPQLARRARPEIVQQIVSSESRL